VLHTRAGCGRQPFAKLKIQVYVLATFIALGGGKIEGSVYSIIPLRTDTRAIEHCMFHGFDLRRNEAGKAAGTGNVDAENQNLINHECVCRTLNRHFSQTRFRRCIFYSTISVSRFI
ncbi:MAG: hypothetical protein ACK498_05550, partial [Cyclobacteriaceae bacterium]